MTHLATVARDYKEHEANVIKNATQFIACEFRGRGTYRKESRPTRAGARLAAERLISQRDPKDPTCKGRPVLVYAWDGMHQVVCDTVYP